MIFNSFLVMGHSYNTLGAQFGIGVLKTQKIVHQTCEVV